MLLFVDNAVTFVPPAPTPPIPHRRRRFRVGAGLTSITSELMSSVCRSISICLRTSSFSFRKVSLSSFRLS